ncbi:L-tyrosine/L-tryptophan isonitrile synthase family protein [Raoultella sp. 10-1]|nr:L-tyrosine/L-tryptophan isonitrile synthase family protein [Raoultella sp. 10-1]
MNNIYTPQKEDGELLRRVILNQVLQAVARYVAAYESNTAGKNTTGFDDVCSLLPETLRMSIHRKDEKHGHYSVQISPSSSRVPWHGVAVLEPTQNGFLLDVRLEREVRIAGYTGVSPTGREQPPFFGLAPIFPYTFYHLTHYWFAAADIPVGNDIPVHYADAIRCNVRRPPQGSLPLLTRRAWA